MDCKTARLLLDYHRPRRTELDPAEARALEDHLAACPDCDAAARAERRLDDQFGRAVRQVEVPPGLKARLLDRLAADRRRRRLARTLRFAAVAAALLLATWGGHAWLGSRRTAVDLQALWNRIQERLVNPPADGAAVQAAFRRMGVDAVPPERFNYAYLAAYGLAEFQGDWVPQLVFVRNDPLSKVHAYAQVYILSARRFNLATLPGDFRPEEGYAVRVDVLPGGEQAYVVVHTGDNLTWLEREDERVAG